MSSLAFDLGEGYRNVGLKEGLSKDGMKGKNKVRPNLKKHMIPTNQYGL